MPATAGRLRFAMSRLIDRDPTTVLLRRNERVRAGGGFTEVPTQQGPYRARIAPVRVAEAREIASLGGPRRSDRGWVLLILAPADIKLAETITTTIDTSMGTFRVTDYTEVSANAQTVGYVVDLERA